MAYNFNKNKILVFNKYITHNCKIKYMSIK